MFGNNIKTVALGILQLYELHFNHREHMNKESRAWFLIRWGHRWIFCHNSSVSREPQRPCPGVCKWTGLLLCWEEVRSSFFLCLVLCFSLKWRVKQSRELLVQIQSMFIDCFLSSFLSLFLFVSLRWALSIEPWLFWNILHRPVWHWTQRDPPASPLKCWNQRPMPTTPGLHHDFLRFTCSESVWNTLKRKKARQT